MTVHTPQLAPMPAGDDSPMTILAHEGLPDIAEVFTARMRLGNAHSLVEFVDGTDGVRTRRDKWIMNLSTQFGCPVRCRFCDAGGEYHGDLSAAEMLAQVAFLLRRHPDLAGRCGKLKIHFARMGEPSLNDAVLEAMARLPELVRAPALWVCIATVAPAGREDWFRRLFAVKNRLFHQRFQLQFSVNATCDRQRERLMPIRLASLDEIATYVVLFHQPGDRKAVLNFALERDAAFEPREIIRRFDPDRAAIKLTPLNPTAAAEVNGLQSVLRSPDSGSLAAKVSHLSAAGFDVIFSVGDGREDAIGSNCGQSVRRLTATSGQSPPL